MIEEEKNHGVLITEPTSTDYIAGAVTSPVPILQINPSGDNRPYKPAQETQSGPGGDKMDCVTVSSGGCIETVLKALQTLKLFSAEHLVWLTKWKFIDDQGNINLSRRWAAIQNGTTLQGNSANAVGQWWHDNGFIPEWMLPNDQTMSPPQYYDKGCLTDQMRQCAKESLQFFQINYQWVVGDDSASTDALKRGAVQLLTAVCSGWNQGNTTPVPSCNLPVEHATELLFVEPNGVKDFFDSYDPFNKQLAANYVIPYRMLYTLLPLKQDNDMVMFQQAGNPDVYTLAGDTLIPFANWDAYKDNFATAKIIVLPPSEFAKLTVADSQVVKK